MRTQYDHMTEEELNRAIGTMSEMVNDMRQALENKRPPTPLELRQSYDNLSWTLSHLTANQIARGMDDYYSDHHHELYLTLMREHPYLMGDVLIGDPTELSHLSSSIVTEARFDDETHVYELRWDITEQGMLLSVRELTIGENLLFGGERITVGIDGWEITR